LLAEDLAERPPLVEDPGAHGPDEGLAADEARLQRQEPEEQVAVRGVGHGLTSAGRAGKRDSPAREGRQGPSPTPQLVKGERESQQETRPRGDRPYLSAG